jgi:uncharacterized protein YceK
METKMTKKHITILLAFILIAGVVLLSGCAGTGSIQKDWSSSTTAADVIPTAVPGYTYVDSDKLTSTVIQVGGSAVGDAYAGTVGSKFYTCLVRAGAVKSSGFYMSGNPIYGGYIAAVDRNQITDPNLLFSCVRKAMFYSIAGVELKGCSAAYTVKTPSNEFYIIMAGTNTTVCQTFCQYIKDQACP